MYVYCTEEFPFFSLYKDPKEENKILQHSVTLIDSLSKIARMICPRSLACGQAYQYTGRAQPSALASLFR